MNTRRPQPRRARAHAAFTLIELLVVLSIIAILVSLLLPSMRLSRQSGRTMRCIANQHEMILAWTLYANDYKDYAMPMVADLPKAKRESTPFRYWFGKDTPGTGRADMESGVISPYISQEQVLNCPLGLPDRELAIGESATSYGYNGYYLSPINTPGWDTQIAGRPWQRLGTITAPSSVFVFGDTLLASGPVPMLTSLLDPPAVYRRSQRRWVRNPNPTTAFRHAVHADNPAIGSAVLAHADGSTRVYRSDPSWIVNLDQSRATGIGSVGTTNDPHYVPDWREW